MDGSGGDGRNLCVSYKCLEYRNAISTRENCRKKTNLLEFIERSGVARMDVSRGDGRNLFVVLCSEYRNAPFEYRPDVTCDPMQI